MFAGDLKKNVMVDALQDLMVMCQHARGTFDTAMAYFFSEATSRKDGC
jgi:DNA-directed RNA polymerase I and III subunit RPAC2